MGKHLTGLLHYSKSWCVCLPTNGYFITGLNIIPHLKHLILLLDVLFCLIYGVLARPPELRLTDSFRLSTFRWTVCIGWMSGWITTPHIGTESFIYFSFRLYFHALVLGRECLSYLGYVSWFICKGEQTIKPKWTTTNMNNILKMYALGSRLVCAFMQPYAQMENKHCSPNGNTETLICGSAMVSSKGDKRSKEYWNQSRPALHPRHESAAVIEPLNAEQTARNDITRIEMHQAGSSGRSPGFVVHKWWPVEK